MAETTRRRVYLAQVNQRYGRNVFLPYSVGLLWAYASQSETVARTFELGGFIYLRLGIAKTIGDMVAPDVLAASCYVWNWEYNCALARATKERHPHCLVVMGGPQVPNRSDDFFKSHPYVDILVHQEGEAAFRAILEERQKLAPDYAAIPGISLRQPGNECRRTGPGTRMTDLESIPSPYLLGLFDSLLEEPYDFHASQETHRGCPYACTFCDWGSAVFTKVRQFSQARLWREFEWFGRHKIDLLYNCDANYGMLKRDLELTRTMVDVKSRLGFPNKFRAAYAKKSDNKVLQIARLLDQADMNKGVTLSLQSMDSHTLDVVKRSNIKVADFGRLVREYKELGIATYTELIMGLPGESYETFANGIENILEAGQHDSINIYPCMMLPNSELADPKYITAHGIRSRRMPIMWLHGTPAPDDLTEYYDIVVETSSMSLADWRRMFLFSWAIQAFHCLGQLQFIAMFLRNFAGVGYRAFYEAVLEHAKAHSDDALGREFSMVDALLDRVLAGGAWDIVLPEFGEVTWPVEEATYLRLIDHRDAMFDEAGAIMMRLAAKAGHPMDANLANDVLRYQKHAILGPHASVRTELDLQYDLHTYFADLHLGRPAKLDATPCTLQIASPKDYGGRYEQFAREVIWYGRKGGRFKYDRITVKKRLVA